MNIALIGYGKMGKEIETHVKSKKITITEVFHHTNPPTMEKLLSADVCIDFSVSSAVVKNVRLAAEARKNIVLGTTGWHSEMETIRKIVSDNGIGLIHASNFSIGVNLFFHMVNQAALLMDHFEEYDAYIHEQHHSQKIDSPSGTALTLAKIMTDHLARKTHVAADRVEGKIDPSALHVSSTRSGSMPGMHVVGFDSAADSIELKHIARSRAGFALGALFAAQWILGKKGLYTLEDALNF